jgi:hypothetical protein
MCHVPCAICHLPFAICHLPFAICHLPFAMCHVPCAMCHLPFAICHLPFAICHLPFAMCHVPCAMCHVPCAIICDVRLCDVLNFTVRKVCFPFGGHRKGGWPWPSALATMHHGQEAWPRSVASAKTNRRPCRKASSTLVRGGLHPWMFLTRPLACSLDYSYTTYTGIPVLERTGSSQITGTYAGKTRMMNACTTRRKSRIHWQTTYFRVIKNSEVSK